MYSELFDQLGRGRTGGASSNAVETPPPVVSFKAGRMNLEKKDGDESYQCTADTARGEIRLVVKPSDNTLEWQWYDRRRDTVAETFPVTEKHSVFSKIETLGSNNQKTDRIYVWTRPHDKDTPYKMYWMQDADPSQDEDLVKTVNEQLKNPPTPTTTGGTGGEVDALSSILENLGMPQEPAAAAAAASSSGGGANQLTLADLQGAMAGIQQQGQPHPSLPEVVTTQAMQELLNDEAASARLSAFLPPGQELRENLMSADIQQSLAALTQVVNSPNYASVIANFELEDTSGTGGMAGFLDAITRKAKKEKEEAENADGDTEMKDELKDEEKEGS